jgi:hypothetical protein
VNSLIIFKMGFEVFFKKGFFMNKLVLLMGFLFLGACSSMSKEQCQTTDWRSLGESRGQRGTGLYLDHYIKECSEHSVTVNTEAYKAGYQKGLVKYCNYESGFQLGMRHDSIPNIVTNTCEGLRSNSEYLRGFNQGKLERNAELVKLEEERKKEELENRERRLQERELELAKKEAFIQGQESVSNTGKWRRCSTSSECSIIDNCNSGRCEASGRSCDMDSDCESTGTCEYISQINNGNTLRGYFCRFK